MSKKPLDTQIGGDHYKSLPIQPMEYSMLNGLDACQHTIIKYVTRFRDKGGIEDLHKARHCIDMLIGFETEYGQLDAGWTPGAIDAAKLPDWNAAENRMDAIGQNGATGEHYLHPLTDYIHSAPAWASRVHQPAGESNVYAQNDDGRASLIKSGVQAWHEHRTLELPPLRRLVCVNNDEAAGQLTRHGGYVTRSPAGEVVCFVKGDDGEVCAFASHRFIEEAY